MAATATQVAIEIVSRPFDTMKELALCPEQDMDNIRKWSEPIPSWREECVHEIFSQRSAENPEALAVSAWDGELTYQELECLSSNLAAQMTGQGVRMETFVALCMEKSKWTIVAILAVLKTGGAYVLLDPSWPLSRMQTICEDLHVRLVLSSPELSQTAQNLMAQMVVVSEDAAVLPDSHVSRPLPTSDPRNALYAVFTSGSTGKPKGIVVEHGAFCSRAMTTGRSLGIERDSRVLQFAGYAFDVVNRDILFTLMLGACVCVPAETDRVNRLEGFMTDHHVSWASITPSVADLLDPAKVPDLKTLVLVGEAMSAVTLATWANQVQLINGYGPAECVTLCSVCSGLTANSDPRNIGRGVGSLLWIVDPQDHNRLMPVGAVGELLVAGVAVGRGYLNDPERTNAAFLQDATWLPKVCPGFRGRLYKTGDLAQYTGDEEGTIRFLGRKDNQVKIHGQRLESGELEHHIRNCLGDNSDINRVVVDLVSLPAGDSTAADNRKLAAFLSFGGGKRTEAVGDDIRTLLGPLDRAPDYLETLESRLAAVVPGYMIPTLIIPIWHIPLNPSGKTDRKALRQMAVEMQLDEIAQCMGSSVLSSEKGNDDNKDYDETKEERDLRTQWSRVLNAAESSISRNDHFFRRGGDSIAVMKLVGCAGEVGISLTFADVFANPTLAAQAEMVATAAAASSSSTSIGTTNSTAASSRGSDIDDGIPPFALSREPAKKREALQALAAEECGLSPSQIEDIYPTTPMQEGLLALTAVQQGTYIAQQVYHVHEDVSLTGLEAAWKATLDANPPLRTRIIQDLDGDTFQVVVRGGQEETTVMPIHEDLDEYLRHDKNKSMSLGQPLARLAVAARRTPAPRQGKMACVLTMHHSIFDAWSTPLVLEQVEAAYRGARLAHRPFSPFVDYIAECAVASKDYWGAKLSNLEAIQFPALSSPTYTPAATGSTSVKVALPSPLPSSASHAVTLSNRIRLAWALTLASYTGLDDVVFGVTVSGRGAPVPGIEHIAGATLATYPQRVQLRPTASIGEELQAIQLDSIATVPFEQFGLQYISRLGEEPARACRFQSLLVVQQQEEEKEAGSGILRTDPDFDGQPAGGTHALTVLCTPTSDNQSVIHVEGIFDARVIPEAQTHRVLNLFAHVLVQLTTAGPDQQVADLDGTSGEDLLQLEAWNREVSPRLPVCVHELIGQHSQSQPEAKAIAAWDGELAYGELDEMSSRLAVSLAKRGVQPETFVPLCMEKSRWVAVAMLAVTKAGGAFILLDPSHPIPRLQQICQDTHATTLFSSVATFDLAKQLGCRHVLPVGAGDKGASTNIPRESDSDDDNNDGVLVPRQARPNSALYAVFTSGSTGKAKGVVIENGAFATNAAVTGPAYLLNKQSRVLQFASHAFDATVLDYLFPLVCGGCVCVPNEAASRDDLAQSINDLQVNWAALTPSVARILNPDALPTLEVLALVGEAAKAVDVATWADRVRLLNAYGPAECAVVSTIRTRIDTASHNPANIGCGAAGATWLVDPNNHDKLAPIGSVGELLLEGLMVGRGYLDNSEQTAASFIPFPDWLRRLRPGKDGGKLYKTGDLARYSWAGDGSLDYIGRKDNQVKIRGQRIELGEIEYQVGQCLPLAADVLVDIITPSDPNAQPLLVAFVWNGAPSEPQQAQDERDLLPFSLPEEAFQLTATQTELALRRSTLPRYMIPSLFILLSYLPLSSTGKANRRRIKESASSLSRRDLEQYRGNGTSSSPSCNKRPPLSEMEGSLKKLVVHVLRLDPAEVGMDDHFFHLGGDSLSAMSISAQARRMGLNVKVVDIFSYPQLSDLAAAVTRNANGKGEHAGADDEIPAPFSLVSPAEGLEKETIIQVAVEQCGLEGTQQIDDMYPCTSMQEGLLALTMQQSEAYITKQVLVLSENTDVARFHDAWRAVCEANPILRTRIVSVGADGHLYQVVVRSSSSSTVHGVASASSGDHQSFSARLGGPLFNIRTISMPQNRYQVVLSLHHSIYDGISMKLILDQLESAYYNREALRLRPYSPFVRYCASGPSESDIAEFWKQELAGATTPPFPAVPVHGFVLQAPASVEEDIPFHLDPRASIPVAAALKLAWGIVVSQYTRENDVIFGTVVSGRSAAVQDIDQLSGPTIATVPFRVHYDSTMTVQEALEEVQARTARMIPFEQNGLQRISQLGYEDACRFQNLLLIQTPGVEDAPTSALYQVMQPDDEEDQQRVFDTYPLTIVCTPSPDRVAVRAIFDRGLIDNASMQRLLAQFAHVLTYLNTSVNRQRPLTKMPPVSATDMAKLQTWNGALPPSEDHCIHELVGEMAAARPQAPAICAWDGELLYGRLDRLSSLLANQILAIDSLGPDAIVPVYFEKSKWTAVAALAVMKSGRTFMLLDTGYPLKRLEDICQSIQPVVIISSSHTTSLASSLAPTTITVTDEYANWLEQCDDGENKMKQLSNRKVSSDHPLYVVFTSGSTGKPKGVVNSHRGFCSMSRAHAGIIGFNPDMRSLAFSSYSFDVSISDMFNPLLAGGCVCVPSDADRTENLPEVIARLRVNYVDMTPSLLRTLRPQDLPFVKTVVLGGEALTREIVTTWAPHVHLVNIYGPAECCPSSTVRTGLTPDTDPSDIGIGAGCLCWVVDPADHGRLVPIGAVGELLIEGPIVGCGYLNNPAQTAASFVEPPSWLVPLRPNGYRTNLYKTGDLVHYAPNGSIRFLGRKDNQVKLRGQRIELEEVEHHIRQHLLQQQEGSGGDVVVEVVKPVAPRPAFLAAFLLQDDDCKKADSNNGLLASVPSPRFRHMIPAVESELQNHMPAYMVPAVFIPILRLPLTPTGKTDRRRLREAAAVLPQTQLDEYTPMAAAAAAGGHRMPYTAGEEALQNIWAKVLNRPPQQISVDANFFRLGGDSISAMQLSSQCRAAGYVCKVADIFKYKTIAALTSILESTHLAPGHSNDGKIQGTIKEEEEREARGDPFDLSPIQQTFFDEVPAVLRNHYNQSLILRLSRSLAPTDISRAVEMLVDRHSMLRARFHQAEGRWVQAIIPSSNLVSLSLCYHHHAVSHAEARSIMSNSQQSFDIEHGRVFRTDIIEVDGDGQYIFMVAHHLAIDLVSWRIILDDLEHLLTTDSFSKLSPPSLSFRSWCRLQQDYSQARLSPASVLSAPLPRFNLDYWDLAPEQNTFGVGIDIGFTLDEGITSVLMGSANETFRTSTVDLLHAALLHSFAFTFQDRPAPVFFSEGHGREPWDDSIDLSRTVGWFTTLWPTYVPADAQMSLGDMVRRVKDGRRQIPGNGWAYFASRYLNPEGRRTLAHGQPEIVFNYLGQSQQLESVGALLQPSVSLTKTADMSPDIPRPTIFDISASVTQGRLQMEFSHSRHLPQSSAVEAWVRQCKISLYQVGECLQALPTSFTLCDLPLLSLGSYHDLDHLIDQTLGQVGLAPVDVENIYPCSPVQGGILLAQARDPSRYVTHEVGRVVPSAGNSTVDLDRFKRAWQAVVDRHPILRTVFVESLGSSQGYWNQIVLKPMTVPVDIRVVQRFESSKTTKPVGMDMAMDGKQPPHRLTLCQELGGNLWYDLCIHHALVDGLSARYIQQDLVRAYDDQLPRGTSPVPYGDYISYVQQQSEEDAYSYWLEYLDGARPCHFPSLLQPDTPKNVAAAAATGDQGRDSVDTSIKLPISYANVSSKLGVTLPNIMKLAWGLVLRCYTGSDSVCFAYLTSGRDIPLQGIDQAIGPFINLLPCRMELPAHTPLPDALQRAQSDYTSALDHQHCGLADIFHAMNLGGKSLFNTGISIQSVADPSPDRTAASSISLVPVHSDDAVDYDVTLNISLRRDSTTMTLNYSTDILSRPQALNVTNLFGQIVSEVINPVELTLGQLSPFGPGPQGHVWRHFSGRQSSEEYWRTHLMDADSAAIFPALLAGDYVPVVDHSLHSVFPTTTTDDPSVLICAAWAIVQAHHTDSSIIIFAATRDISQKAEQEMVPCCLRVLPDDPISSVLSAIRRHRTEAAGLSQTARQSLLKEFPDSRGVAFSVQEASHSLLSPHSSPSSLPHSLTIIASIHQDDSLRVTAQFDSRVMSDVECQRLLQQLEHVFNSVATGDPYQQIGQVSVISPQDLALLKEWNRTPPTPLNRCVHDLIMDRCESNPAALSISAWDGCFTYGELRDLSGRLATHLLKQSGGAVRTAKVPVCMEKSQVVPVAILAVLRAGATCVMVDPSQPLQRVHALTKDLAAPLAVVSSSGASAMNEIVANPIVVSSAMLNTLPPSSTPFPAVNPQSPAFIVFTSGSTGKPKGIVMRHYNISSALRDLPLSHNVTTGLRMLHFASYAFDASLSETFLALSTGSCLCIPSEFDRTNDLSGFIREQNINWAILTPSAAAVLHPADVPSLQTLLLVGEPLPSRAVDLWAADRTLINGYGPAECSFACAVGRVPSRGWKPGTIGPVVNGLGWITTVSDPSRLAAIGAVGELLVEGPSVTAGYLDEPEKTAASFIPGPAWLQDFRNDTTATRLYRTGDLVQFTGGGEIRFVGRRDTQVKLNGQRIELGEVEHNVRAGFPDGTVVIAEVVTPAGDHPRPLLVAFVCIQPSQKKSNDHPVEAVPVPNDLFRFQVEAARTHFLSVLPRHMVPAAFLPLNYIPFSAAGKADRRRLREMAGSMSRTELEKFMASECKSSSSSPPSTGLERLLQQLFAQVLRVPPESISSEHSFFQLGGDSVVAMALVSMARRAGVRISIANVFRHPRLSDLASIIKIDSEVVPSKQAAEDGQRGLDQKLASYTSSYLALSSREALLESVLRSCQSHLSADDISEVLPVTGFQNMELRGQPCIYRILHFDKPLDYDRLEAACQALMQRHSILRTTFQPHGDTALQIVHVHPEARLQRMYLAVHDPQYVERVCTAQENDKGTFNTSITQFTIVQGLSPIHHSLIIRLSHAQYDGVSMPMLYNDLKCLYEGSPLPQATPFTAHMEHWLDAQGSQSALSYWQGLLEASSMTYLRDPSLPQDRKDPTDNNLVMVKRQCHLGDSLTKKAGITTATLVKAAWAFVLMQITQQNDVTFAQTVSTRKLDAPNTTNVVGPCINHVPVRVPLQHSWTILDLLQYVQNQHTESEPFNIFDHSSIVDRCSAWSKKNSFGSLVTHQNIDTGPSSGSSFSIGNAECVSVDSSLGEKLRLPPHETVMVTTFPGTGNLGLVIQLEASSRTLGPKYANVVVQHLENAIQHFVGSPSTNISALLS